MNLPLPVSNSSVAFLNNPGVQAQFYILMSRNTAESWDTAEHHDPHAETEHEEKLLRKLKPSPASFS